tara:strand:+ start:11072 stop:12268 length:1197 start_codon:yes stop_codon:yes gene_type:complete
MSDLITNNIQTHAFEKAVKMSAFQPIEVRPVIGRDWVLNGLNNLNFKVYRDAYDDSPTNQSIINAFVNYVYGEGLYNASNINDININKYLSKQDALLICQDYKIYGGYAVQIIWNSSDSEKKPLKIEYIPVYKLGVNYDMETEIINGFWYSWDWEKRYTYRPQLYPKFTGSYNGNDLEILVVKRPHAEPFFPIPDYISGVPWARVEGELANAGFNHFKNAMSDITVINYNQGRQATPELAKIEAQKARDKVVGTDNQSSVIVSFNDGAEEAVIVDRISPPELNQQNVFYSEEAERKLIVAHSAPPILFSGTNSGSGFSSNADEIETATNSLYRRHINPMREIILDGLSQIFDLIDITIKLDFKDFKEEKLEGEEVVKKEVIETPAPEDRSLMQKIFKK